MHITDGARSKRAFGLLDAHRLFSLITSQFQGARAPEKYLENTNKSGKLLTGAFQIEEASLVIMRTVKVDIASKKGSKKEVMDAY